MYMVSDSTASHLQRARLEDLRAAMGSGGRRSGVLRVALGERLVRLGTHLTGDLPAAPSIVNSAV